MIKSADSMDFATEVCPNRRLPSRMTNSRDLVSQEFSERDRVRSKYLSVASPRLTSDRALQSLDLAHAHFFIDNVGGARGT